MKKMNGLMLFLVIVLCVSGCVTVPVSSKSEIEQLQSQISDLQTELNVAKAENASLKQELSQLASKKAVRMPNAGEIQAALKKAGFYQGEVDGQIGTKTKDAIKKFQEANGINPDGVVGSRTWQLLEKYLEEKK
jgi:cell division protein FtsL